MQERLERAKYSDAQLLEIISGQVLEGNCINFQLLVSISYSTSFKCVTVDLKKVIEMTIKRCDEECIHGTNSHALMLRGFLFHRGIGSSVNYVESIRCYEKAIHLGNALAMNNRGYMYQHGQGAPVDYAKAIVLYEQAIALGDADAMNNRAYMYQKGRGEPVDYDAAIALYAQAIALGDADAMNNRAYMYREGRGGPVDYDAAIALYAQAIALGDADAMNNRGYMYQYGQGTPVDYAKAIVLYEQAIALGDADAMNNRAYMYQEGRGGPVDYDAAIALYDQAIALGDANAMVNRALMHEKGRGGAVDDAQAIILYEQAIVLGDVYAMYNRALMHEEGRGGPVDDAQAIVLYEQAIALGDAGAMVNRALMHEEGRGGPVDDAQAIVLYEQALRSGSDDAQDKLQLIDITSEIALTVLDLLWEELVKGMSFSTHTLTALSLYCKKSVLERINESYLGTCLSFLKQLITNPQHPLAVIINDGKTNEESAELKQLMGQTRSIIGARQTFFYEQFSLPLPPEIKNHVFSFLQPGMNYEHQAAQRQNALNDAALKRACMKQDLAAIKRLMEGNLDNKPSTDAVYEALTTAVEKGYLSAAKQLSPYLQLDDECIETLCYCAQTHNQEPIINWLIETYGVHQELIGMTSNPK